MDVLKLIDRKNKLFVQDTVDNEEKIASIIEESAFLVLGGAGTIGCATVKEIFKRNPKLLHVVDISENNLVELVRDLRSDFGYIDGEFKTYALDIGSEIYNKFIDNFGSYDYVLNFSALKHVRSEKDAYTLMRMIEVNILNTIKTLDQAIKNNSKKYFCVSTDKAANPVNMMGASKRIMEMFLAKFSENISISTARFANVAFSDGSLLHSFNQRIEKQQPIVAPNDIRRYFVSASESGMLCLMSTIFGDNLDVFFPKLNSNLHLSTFSSIATRYLKELGFEAYECESEQEARDLMCSLPALKKWPCYFFKSDTTGEKDVEEFYTESEKLDMDTYCDLGVIKTEAIVSDDLLNNFVDKISEMKSSKQWDKLELINLFNEMIVNFEHLDKGKFLDEKM